MSAHTIIDNAPLGSIVTWSDGTPQPPARFNKKLAAWRTNNSTGRLVRKQGERGVGNIPRPACFTLHEADYGSSGDRVGDDAELVYLATSEADAKEWLTRHGYPRAVLEEVMADEVGADSVEGRAVA